MGYGSLLVASGYALFCAALVAFELYRIRRRGPDTITTFMVLYLLQCVLAGAAIYVLLPFVGSDSPTGVDAFDRILTSVDVVTALLVLCLSIAFALFFYLGCALGRLALPAGGAKSRRYSIEMEVRPRLLLMFIAVGMAITLYSFWLMGDNVVIRYTQLILFRAEAGDVERNALNANSLALTQTWGWLSVVALLAVIERKSFRWVVPACAIAVVVFAVLGVSRRALFLPVLLIYLAIVLHSGRWHVRWLVLLTPPMLLIVAFGKNAQAALAYGGSADTVMATYDSWAGAALRAGADVGLTIVESIGTIMFVDGGLRMGADHLLSLVKLMPEQMFGFQIDYPERIVRISTEAFAGPDMQDIPPGLFGQMWLDFRIVGPVVWGIVFGLAMSVVQFAFENVKRTQAVCAVITVITFVIALPLNTGSFDFTFSIDIVALLAVLVFCVALRRRPLSSTFDKQA